MNKEKGDDFYAIIGRFKTNCDWNQVGYYVTSDVFSYSGSEEFDALENITKEIKNKARKTFIHDVKQAHSFDYGLYICSVDAESLRTTIVDTIIESD